jgi:hypothetical protein
VLLTRKRRSSPRMHEAQVFLALPQPQHLAHQPQPISSSAPRTRDQAAPLAPATSPYAFCQPLVFSVACLKSSAETLASFLDLCLGFKTPQASPQVVLWQRPRSTAACSATASRTYPRVGRKRRSGGRNRLRPYRCLRAARGPGQALHVPGHQSDPKVHPRRLPRGQHQAERCRLPAPGRRGLIPALVTPDGSVLAVQLEGAESGASVRTSRGWYYPTGSAPC